MITLTARTDVIGGGERAWKYGGGEDAPSSDLAREMGTHLME